MPQGISVDQRQQGLLKLPAWKTLLRLYFPYEFSVYYLPERMATQIDVRWTSKNGLIYKQSYVVGDDIHANFDPDFVVGKFIKECVEPFTVSIGESETGRYPFIRLWADRHITSVELLFGHPEVDIPGFVFPKFRTNGEGTEYPRHGSVTPRRPDVIGGTELPEVDAEGDTEHSKILSSIHFTDTRKIERQIKMAQGKVKIKKRPINPDRVKKPNCVKHDKPMEFDAVSQKWRCKVDGCNMVARPKDDENDRSVTIGKGGIQMRLIFHEGKATVLLISDNNIALDVTRWIDVDAMVRDLELEEKIKAADDEDQTSFVLTDQIATILKGLTLHIMGVDDYVLNN